MSDIIVTTPKSRIAESAEEAQECIADGGGEYFRLLGWNKPNVQVGDRQYYVEDGYVRGFAVIKKLAYEDGKVCATTGLCYREGWYTLMDAATWTWIEPIPMRGFQGWQYARLNSVKIIGGWLDPKPPDNYHTPQSIIDFACGTGTALADTFDAVIKNPMWKQE